MSRLPPVAVIEDKAKNEIWDILVDSGLTSTVTYSPATRLYTVTIDECIGYGSTVHDALLDAWPVEGIADEDDDV